MTEKSKNIKPKIQPETIAIGLNKKYKTLLNELKSKIRRARLKAALAVNHEVIGLYGILVNKSLSGKTGAVSWLKHYLKI